MFNTFIDQGVGSARAIEQDDLLLDAKRLTQFAKEQSKEDTETHHFTDIETATHFKMLLRRPTMLRILMYLKDREIASVKEITDGINADGGPILTYRAVYGLLPKLVKARIVNSSRSMIDRRYPQYGLNRRFPITRLLEQMSPDLVKRKGYCSLWDKKDIC